MKKVIFVFVLAMAGWGMVNAQSSAIGGRVGTGIEFSYLHGLNSGNRLGIDVGLPLFAGISGVVTHDWVFPFSSWQERGSWNWFAGIGGGLGLSWNGHFNVGVAGRIGVEYNFWFPLQLSLDWRPVIGPGFGSGNAYFYTNGFYAGAIALGIRYIIR